MPIKLYLYVFSDVSVLF